MNVLEATLINSPSGREEECAKFIIDDTSSPFRLTDITTAGQKYTLSFWIRSGAAGQLYAAGQTLTISSDWQKHIITFEASGSFVTFLFQIVGTYYIYHPQLELGNTPTDWSPAPEDLDFNKEIESLYESIAELCVEADNISASVRETKTTVETITKEIDEELDSVYREIITMEQSVADLDITAQGITQTVSKLEETTTKTFEDINESMGSMGEEVASNTLELSTVKSSMASLTTTAEGIVGSVSTLEQTTQKSIDDTNKTIESLSKEVSAKMSSEAVELQIKKELENGTDKVVTSTGYRFDESGMTVEKAGSEMKTQITENGMTVYQNGQDVLVANNNGVDAKNLHAITYLIVGGRSRFENYGSDRTGCFWIGG